MRRRRFLALCGGAAAAAASPVGARAQKHEQARRLGVLMSNPESDPLGQARVAAPRAGLLELGWSEASNLRIDVRWAGSDASRINDYAAELVRLAPDVIVTNGTPGTAVREWATRSIPIVFAVVNDPVEQGLIAGLAHPGGNVTGLSFVDFPLFGKSLELLRHAPTLTRVGLMFRPADHPYYDDYLKSFAADKRILPTVITRAGVTTAAEIEGEVGNLAGPPPGGLIVAPDTFTVANRQTILASVAQQQRPRHPCLSASGGGRRSDVLRAGHLGYFPALRCLCRPHSQGREAGRPAGRGA